MLSTTSASKNWFLKKIKLSLLTNRRPW